MTRQEYQLLNEHKYLFVEPGRDRRRRTDQLKQLLRAEPGEERTRQLAMLVRQLHDNREINLALDAARHVLEDAGGDTSVLVEAYTTHGRPDLQIDELSMLTNLCRWLQHDALCAATLERAYEVALSWCATADGRERERRLDILRRRFDADLADRVDLALL